MARKTNIPTTLSKNRNPKGLSNYDLPQLCLLTYHILHTLFNYLVVIRGKTSRHNKMLAIDKSINN